VEKASSSVYLLGDSSPLFIFEHAWRLPYPSLPLGDFPPLILLSLYFLSILLNIELLLLLGNIRSKEEPSCLWPEG
jgi:hypothetical protein